MKPISPLLLSLISLVSVVSPGFGEDVDRSLWNIQVEVQIVELPEDIARPLIPELLNEKTIEAANEKVQALLAAKKATLIGWPILTTKSGQRAVIEAIDEIRYVAEYEAPSAEAGATVAEKMAEKAEHKAERTEFLPTPKSFEVRNAGVTLEVEPVLSPDAGKIDLNLVPQYVKLAGYKKITVEKDHAKLTVEQPEFHTTKVSTSLTLRNGQRKLLGVHKVSDPAGQVELFILKASAIELK